MAEVQANGVRLAYDDEDSGPPVVLVHGSWTNRRSFDRVAPALAQRFRVVRYDRRGHSESEATGGTVGDDVMDIVGLAEALDLGPAIHLVCSSRGGVIGLALTAHHPDLVASIACAPVPLRPGGPDRPDACRVGSRYMPGPRPRGRRG